MQQSNCSKAGIIAYKGWGFTFGLFAKYFIEDTNI
jgi:hypothetical protein